MAEREKLIELKDLQITFGSGKKEICGRGPCQF